MSTWDLPSSSPFRPWTDDESDRLDLQTRRLRGAMTGRARTLTDDNPAPMSNGSGWLARRINPADGRKQQKVWSSKAEATAWIKEGTNG